MMFWKEAIMGIVTVPIIAGAGAFDSNPLTESCLSLPSTIILTTALGTLLMARRKVFCYPL